MQNIGKAILILLYQNLMGSANQKTAIDLHTNKKKQSKHNTTDSHQIRTEENKRRKKTNKKKRKHRTLTYGQSSDKQRIIFDH